MGGETLPVSMEVNGETQTHRVEPRMLLVHYLRDVLGLTGTHVGCDTSQCGACTVMVDDLAVKSCTVLAVQAEGSKIATVEGLAKHGLSPVQQAFWEEHGLQCGFCTPGAMMTAVAILADRPHPTDKEIQEGLDGLLCRCTGYENIVRAVKRTAALMHDDVVEIEGRQA